VPFEARLYAIPEPIRKPGPDRGVAHVRKTAVERKRQPDGLKQKKAIDRASALLDRLEARAASYAKQIAQLQKRKKQAEARYERLEDAIVTRMQKAGVDYAPGFAVEFSTRSAPAAVQIEDASALPPEYLREKVISEPDKNAIKQALARGVEIEGVELTTRLVLIRK
jgi:hypothetical protein